MAKKRNMEIHVAACPPADKVLIESLRETVEDEVALYFESRNCPCGPIDVVSVKMNCGNRSAIVQFQDSSGTCLAFVFDMYF